MVLTSLIVLVDMHVVWLSVPVDVATHVVDWMVVTMLGNELMLSEVEVDRLEEVMTPNKVAVGVGLHAIWVRRAVQNQRKG